MEILGFIIIFLAACALIYILGGSLIDSQRSEQESKEKSNKQGIYIPEINKVNSVRDLVMSINHGRAYPFYTGMSLGRIKDVVKQSCLNYTEFEQELDMQEIIGCVRGARVPLPSTTLVKDVYLHLNRNKVVSSITIDISNFEFVALVELMLVKFGDPISVSGQLMVWRDTCMTISLDSINKYINIMDERLPNR